jgi:hypothetical protein
MTVSTNQLLLHDNWFLPDVQNTPRVQHPSKLIPALGSTVVKGLTGAGALVEPGLQTDLPQDRSHSRLEKLGISIVQKVQNRKRDITLCFVYLSSLSVP